MSASSEAFALLSSIQSTKSADELSDVLGRVAEHFNCACFVLSSHEIGSDGADVHLLLDRLPKPFQKRYVSEHYGKVSPVARRSRESDEPFFWHDLHGNSPGSEAQGGKVMRELSEAGLADGFSVPIHLPEGRRGTVSFSGPERLEFSEDQRLALHVLALAAHAQLRHLHRPDAQQPSPRLTAREREILQWTAAGKTADETSRILSISVRTVEYHLLNASRKLNTMNRTHTVVEALRSKQLQL